ncbi:hypothetical protein AAE478_008036 [Parahypoxylon ruwenzoriense]
MISVPSAAAAVGAARMTTTAVLAALLLLLAAGPPAPALAEQKVLLPGGGDGDGDEGNSPFDDGFGTFAREALERWHVPGVAVAVVDGDEMWAEGYGAAALPSTPVTPSTLFYTGSTTKAFTAAVVSLLIDSGNYSDSFGAALGWQTPISRLIGDDFALGEGHEWEAAHLTLEDALSHRTGFPRHDKALGRWYGGRDSPEKHRGTVRDVARGLRYLPMATEPRAAWRYCNLMFMVVSHAVQSLTGGRWLGDAMREWIWEPLGMDATFFSVEEALRREEKGEGDVRVARGYYWDYLGVRGAGEDGKGGGFAEVPFANLDLASGAGGIVSNVVDYARWIRCLVHERGPLSPAAHRELKTARMPMPRESRRGYDAPLSYALGWMLGTYKGHRVFTHSGGMEAYGAEVYFFPDLKYGVVAMGNTAVTANIVGWELAWRLIDERIGVDEEERYDWADAGYKAIDRSVKLADTAVEELYPDRADPPLPRALPLEDYVGTYFHPAYQYVRIELVKDDDGDDGDDDVVSTDGSISSNGECSSDRSTRRRRKGGSQRGELKAMRDDMEWQMTFEFRHASGEFWAVVIDMLNTPNMLNGQLARAEFLVGVGGTADALRMEFLEDGSEGVVTFDRVT